MRPRAAWDDDGEVWGSVVPSVVPCTIRRPRGALISRRMSALVGGWSRTADATRRDREERPCGHDCCRTSQHGCSVVACCVMALLRAARFRTQRSSVRLTNATGNYLISKQSAFIETVATVARCVRLYFRRFTHERGANMSSPLAACALLTCNWVSLAFVAAPTGRVRPLDGHQAVDLMEYKARCAHKKPMRGRVKQHQ